jgi:hypothetical protein
MSEKPQVNPKLLRVLKDPEDEVICTCRGSAQEVFRCIKSQAGWSVRPDVFDGNPRLDEIRVDDSYAGNFRELSEEDEPTLSQYEELMSAMQICAEKGLFNLLTRFPEEEKPDKE